MKKILFLLFPTVLFSQNFIKSELQFQKALKLADSLNYKSDSLIYKLNIINKTDFFRDKLLINDNYKISSKAHDIFNSYSMLTGISYNYPKIITDEKIIKKFFSLQKAFYQVKATIEITTYYYDKKIENASNDVLKKYQQNEFDEDYLIEVLHNAKFPIDKFNKLTDSEKNKILDDISKGYKYQE